MSNDPAPIRLSGLSTAEGFQRSYAGTPPWEIGRPQAPFEAIAAELRSPVLDAGCGTGGLALMAAARGLEATGVDAAPSAIEIARRRCADRGLSAEFVVGDVLQLAAVVPGPFGAVLDSGLFHVFDDDDRARYAGQVSAVVAPGGQLAVLCFSDREPGTWGPRRVSRDELRAAFADGWQVDSIEPALFVMADLPNVRPHAQAWFARFTRV
jgi:SAM-dependent methyltransferase